MAESGVQNKEQLKDGMEEREWKITVPRQNTHPAGRSCHNDFELSLVRFRVQKSGFPSGFIEPEPEYPNYVPYSWDTKQLMSESLNFKDTVSRQCITSMCEGTHGILGAGETAGWQLSRWRSSLCESSDTPNIIWNCSHFGTYFSITSLAPGGVKMA